jgi:hypothetical protein
MIGKDEKYDIAHFEFVMRGVQRAMLRNRRSSRIRSRSACTASSPTS